MAKRRTARAPTAAKRGSKTRLRPRGKPATSRKRFALFNGAASGPIGMERRFRDIFENASECLFVHDAGGRLLDVNESACRSLGYSRAELLGKTVTDVEAGPGAELLLRRLPLMKPGDRRQGEGLHRRKDGGTFPVEVKVSVFETSGAPIFLVSARDISRRKRNEASLTESENRFRALFEESPSSLWEEDFSAVRQRLSELKRSGIADLGEHFLAHPEEVRRCAALVKVLEVNRATLAMHGARAKTELLPNLGGTFLEQSYDAFRDELIALAQGCREFSAESVAQTLKGDKIHIRLKLNVAPGHEDTWKRVIVAIEDITEIKRAEAVAGDVLGELETRVEKRTRDLQDANSKLEREVRERRRAEDEREELLRRERRARSEAETASRAKDEFLAVLSHELRTPMTAMMGWTWMLRSKEMKEAEFDSALEIIERNMKLQAQIIEDLLDISRIITGKLQLDNRPVELSPVIRSVMEIVSPAADARGIRLVCELPPQPQWVLGDSERLQQAIWNLLSNGVKFTEQGGEVRIRLARAADKVEVSVADNGGGIAPKFLPHVFERFLQGEESLTREHSGLGLGLAIVRHVIEMHGGTVRAASEGPGKGAEFTISLPAALPPAAGVEPAADPSAGKVGFEFAATLEGVRVLVVDDDPDTRIMLAAALEHCGAKVTTASSPSAAMPIVESQRPDVLVSDIAMPSEDGISFIRRVRALGAARGGDVPAAALTAKTRVEDRTMVLMAGFQMYVPKPVEPVELAAVVGVLAKRRPEQGRKA